MDSMCAPPITAEVIGGVAEVARFRIGMRFEVSIISTIAPPRQQLNNDNSKHEQQPT